MNTNDTLQLLQKIADNTAENHSLWVAIVAGGAGVLGAGLTSLLGYLAAKKSHQTDERRLRASVVTAERLRWLQDIRQRLARYYVQLDMQYNYLKRPILAGQQAEYQRIMDTFSNEVNEQCNIITLMLNPQREHQVNLKNALHEGLAFILQCIALKLAGTTIFDDVSYRAIKQKAFDSLTIIGVETWDRIKQLE